MTGRLPVWRRPSGCGLVKVIASEHATAVGSAGHEMSALRRTLLRVDVRKG
jgi:hypothetical protein